MKKYFCDVCGIELPGWDKSTAPKPSQTAALCGFTELCPRCDASARELDVAELVKAEIKRLMKIRYKESAQLSVPAPSPKGKAAKEKRAILAAVEAYRQEHGPGSIIKLAQLAKVSESEIREMLLCTPVPITTWRAVGKALGVGSDPDA